MIERCVFLDEVPDGAVLARHVVSKDGSILLDPKTVITPALLGRLEKWGVLTVYVEVPDGAGAPPPEAAPPEIREEITFETGSLPPEAPIDWEELAQDRALSAPPETIEAALEEKAAAVVRIPRLPPPPETFHYRTEELRRAQKVIERVHLEAIRAMPHAIEEVVAREPAALARIRAVVRRLVDFGLTNRHVLAGIAMVREYDDLFVTHTVKSTLYSILLGYALGMPKEELLVLGEAALLHDVGMSKVGPRLWRKEELLTENERWEIAKHTLLGADLLGRVPGVSPWSEVVAYQHHERWDGTGYPKEKRGKVINEYARVVGLADAFAAMTSPRPWRERISGYEAIREIVALAGIRFDPAIVQSFLQILSLFPVGTGVRLTDDRRAIVVGSVPHSPYRPVVRILGDGNRIDLSLETRLGIATPDPLSREEAVAAFSF